MKYLGLVLAAGALTVCSMGRSEASGITYTEQAVMSGSLGASDFRDAQVLFTFTGDTANVTKSGNFYQNSIGNASFTISGLGSGTLTEPIFIFDSQDVSAVGIASNNGSLLDTFNSAFGSYDLKSTHSAVTDDSFIRTDLTFKTSAGNLKLTCAGDSTFTATTPATNSVTAVPEPASVTPFAIAGLGLGALILRGRKRQTAA